MLTEKTQNAIRELQKSYPEKRSALLPALHLAQKEAGYLPRSVQEEVAALFELDLSEVCAVVSFYDMFYEEPVGRHLIHVCKNVSCMLRGADGILQSICQRLKVEPHKTTEDGEFTVIPSECLGACDRAPMMLVDDQVVGPVLEADIDRILVRTKESPAHPCPASPLVQEEGSHA